MSKSDFFGLMRHPEWQKKRLEVLSDANFECRLCNDTQTELHVHHKIYRVNSKPWQYDFDELDCLCSKCHKRETERAREIKEILFVHAFDESVDAVVAAVSPYNPKYLAENSKALMMGEIIQKLLMMEGDDLNKVNEIVSAHENKRVERFYKKHVGRV